MGLSDKHRSPKLATHFEWNLEQWISCEHDRPSDHRAARNIELAIQLTIDVLQLAKYFSLRLFTTK